VASTVVVPPPQQEALNREKVCPLLLRVFVSQHRHHRPHDFGGTTNPPGELQIYTWKDAMLKELGELVKGVHSEARGRDVSLSFSLVYRDRFGKPVVKDIGQVTNGTKTDCDTKALRDTTFVIGDYLDVAILFPRSSNNSGRRIGRDYRA
jgi:histone deacetylase complex subunit SAP18